MLALSAISWMIASLVSGPLFWTTSLFSGPLFWTTLLDHSSGPHFWTVRQPIPFCHHRVLIFFLKNEQRAISSKDTLRMGRFLQIEVYAFRQWLYLFPDHQICRAVFCSFALQSIDILKFSSKSAQTRYLQR